MEEVLNLLSEADENLTTLSILLNRGVTNEKVENYLLDKIDENLEKVASSCYCNIYAIDAAYDFVNEKYERITKLICSR